ncbi:MAG: SCO family protein [Bacteroidetes bacterium]|nr:SCO family protein [Bacteroidota bacterium]
MKLNSLIIILIFCVSCSKLNNENTDYQTQPFDISVSELPDLSIFHLPAKWTTQNKEVIELHDLRGRVLVMVMIYTSCQVACPRLVADMRSIESEIAKNLKGNVKYILVSIDPTTDTPERLKSFALENQMNDEQWLFLQGDEDNVLEFAALLGVRFKKVSPVDFSHSNIISVFDRNGVLVYQQQGLGVDNNETVNIIRALAKSI